VQWHEASVGGHTPVRQSIFEKVKAAQSGQGVAAERDARRMAALEETITLYALIPPKFPQYPFVEDILASGVEWGDRCIHPREALTHGEKVQRSYMMRGFWHVSFTVSNIEASVKWYTEVLGLEFVRDQVQQNEYTSKLVGYADAHLKVAQLRVPGETIPLSRHHIELVEYVHPRGEEIPLDTNRTGVGHWAFMVDDIHAEFQRLKNMGVQFKAEKPVAIEAGVNKGGYTIYFLDPMALPELIQPPLKIENYASTRTTHLGFGDRLGLATQPYRRHALQAGNSPICPAIRTRMLVLADPQQVVDDASRGGSCQWDAPGGCRSLENL
jgi:catechol 2,3-dioxygenase-like lactoylglutathione lyase family enzyme